MIVLLRMVIGWHIGYEGLCKIDPRWAELGMPRTQGAPKQFSAEGYLRNSAGPLRDYFRSLVTDLHGFDRLDATKTAAAWEKQVALNSKHYNFQDDQIVAIKQDLERLISEHKAYVNSTDTTDKITKYKAKLEQFNKVEAEERLRGASGDPLARATRAKIRTDVETARRELVGPVDAWSAELESAITRLLKPEQQSSWAPMKPYEELTDLERVNLSTKWGLAICGVLMFVGLFSRLACLGAAFFLGLFYTSLLWPGLTPMPMTEEPISLSTRT